MAVKTIKSSGGDYTTLSAWEAALPATLTEVETAECYNFALSNAVGFAGITTSATNYLRVYTPTAERHDGRARAVSGTGFSMTAANASGTIQFSGAVNHLRLEGLELIGTSSGVALSYGNLTPTSGNNDHRVENCIIHDALTGTGYTINAAKANLNLTMRNCIVYGSQRSIDVRGLASALIENCVFWRHVAQIGVLCNTTSTVNNCYSGHTGAAADDYWMGSAITGSYNSSSDTTATSRFPTGSVNSIAGSAVFTSITSGAEDFRLVAGTNALVDIGLTLADNTVDIIATVRPQGSAYDIGAFERTSGDITLALTGNEATGAVGTISVASSDITLALTGNAATGAVGTLTAGWVGITEPTNNRVFQRIGTAYTQTIAGTYSGSPTNIECQIVDASTSAVVVAWATVAAAPTGGTWSGTLSVPQGGWYHIQARFSNAHDVTDETSNRFGVGAIVSFAGQSQAMNMFAVGTGTPDDLTVKVSGSSFVSVTGAGAITFANLLSAGLGIPVALQDGGASGSALVAAADGGYGYWLNVATGPLPTWKSAVTALGGKLESIIWLQGESESVAAYGVDGAAYAAGFATLAGYLRAHVSQAALPIYTAPIGTVNNANRTDVSVQGIRDGIVAAAAADAYTDIAADTWDLPRADYVHYDATGYTTLATRLAHHILGTQSRGPSIASVTPISSTQIDVGVTHHGGSDLLPATGVTGFRVLDGKTPATISAAVRQDATTYRITVAAPTTGQVAVGLAYGMLPSVTAPARDDGSYPLQQTLNDGVLGPVVGVSAAGAVGTVSPQISLALTGNAASGAVGTMAATGVGAQYVDTFQSYTPGAGLPTGWTSRWATGGWSVVDDSGDVVLRDNYTTSRNLASCNAVDSDGNRENSEVLIRARSNTFGASNNIIGGAVRGSGAGGAETGYYGLVEGVSGTTYLKIGKYVSGTTTTLGAAVAKTVAANTWYWIRFRANGTDLKLRVWADGSAEPGGWDVERTDSSITADGWCGVFAVSVTGNKDFADFAVATGGLTASMGDVSVAASGNAATGAAGTVSPQISLALTGNAASGAVGSMSVTGALTIALSGNAATGGAGSLTASISLAATGTAATGGVGSAAPSFAKALTGDAATGAVGAVQPPGATVVALTGDAATGYVGSTTVTVVVPMTGVGASGAAGSVTPGTVTTQAITGNAATGAVGAVTFGVTVGITGVHADGGIGSVIPSGGTLTIALTGNLASGAVGSVTVGGLTVSLQIDQRYVVRRRPARYTVQAHK